MNSEMHALKASVWIGKRGLSSTQIEEIKSQLERKKLIKIKVLKSALETLTVKQIAEQIAEHAIAEVLGVTGMVIVVRKRGRL